MTLKNSLLRNPFRRNHHTGRPPDPAAAQQQRGTQQQREDDMQRGSDRLNVHHDDEMKHQLQGMLRSGHSTRAEEWHDPEPAAEDDPATGLRPAPSADAGDEAEAEALRSELARYLGRTPFPGRRDQLLTTLRERNAPDRLVGLIGDLPGDQDYRNVQDVMVALGRKPRS
ncbi:DUF2795 domain-containing protein [Streptomyces albus]|uniref:DUF2795 domain-containing protein n=1 Tax=Streptomyces albus TaxID=1888 RepID=UPI000AB5E58B